MTHRPRSILSRVGVAPVLDPAAGGTFQYSRTLLEALSALLPRYPTVVLIGKASSVKELTAAGYPIVQVEPPSLRRKVGQAVAWVLGDKSATWVASVLRRLRSDPAFGIGDLPEVSFTSASIASWLRSNGVDVLILPWPEPLAIYSRLPYVLAVHDIQHRLQPEFPEVSADGAWEARERLFRDGIARAQFVLVDSEVGREDVLTHYGDVIESDRVRVLPFLPAPYLDPTVSDDTIADLRARHRLPARYLLFPAQFWSHKNHVRVVQAISGLRLNRGVDIPVVMCGSAEGAIREAVLGEVVKEASSGGITDLVCILGYVPDSDMGALYRASAGVLLPTFFGPTNIPVLEGWAMGVPVLTSDIRGIREQCGDAAVLVDPRSVESIAEGMASLWLDDALRSRLIIAGRARLDSYGPDEYRRRLAAILDELEVRLRNDGGMRD